MRTGVSGPRRGPADDAEGVGAPWLMNALSEIDTSESGLEWRGGCKLIIRPEGAMVAPRNQARAETLIAALVRARRWRRRIESEQARWITDLAEQEGVTV